MSRRRSAAEGFRAIGRHCGHALDRCGRTLDRADDWLDGPLFRVLQLWVISCLIFFGYVAWVLVTQTSWPFALEAESRYAEIDLAGDTPTRWNVSDAVLCLREALPGPAPYRLIEDSGLTAKFCGSRHRYAYATPADYHGTSELIAVLGVEADKPSVINARLTSLQNGRLVLALAPSPDANKPATIRIEASTGVPLRLTTPVSFDWQPSASPQPLVFPYTGNLRVGQDVNTARRELLEKGKISIYSPSDTAVGGRALVESLRLLPGDLVELTARTSSVPARGFIRLSAAQSAQAWPKLQIVAFGLSNDLTVRRYGNAGVDFKPSMVSRLAHDDWVITLAVLLFSGLPVLFGFAQARQISRERRKP